MAARLTELVGVYDADGTVVGELSYFIRARLGAAHCALCDITHGRVRERADWKACRDDLAVPFVTFHRDDQPADVRAATTGLPAVVARLDDRRAVELLDRAALESCAGSPGRLLDAIDAALARLGVDRPA